MGVRSHLRYRAVGGNIKDTQDDLAYLLLFFFLFCLFSVLLCMGAYWFLYWMFV